MASPTKKTWNRRIARDAKKTLKRNKQHRKSAKSSAK